jgi:hypothetical protein
MSYHALLAGVGVSLLLAGTTLAESRVFEVPDFDAVSVSGGISAVIDVGGAKAVVADAPTAAVLDRLQIEVRGNRLEVGFKWDALDWLFNFGQHKGVVVHISAPRLGGVSASAAANVDARNVAGTTLSLDASSGASMAAQLVTGQRVSANASSGANLSINGTCDQLIADASSGGSLTARDFTCKNVDANASSGGHASVNATVSIDAEASSGGNIAVSGRAPDVRSNTSSGGSISFAE